MQDEFLPSTCQEKGQLGCKRSCKSPPLAERKWGQLCLGFVETSRKNTKLKILAPQIFSGRQQVCQKLAEGKAWRILTPLT